APLIVAGGREGPHLLVVVGHGGKVVAHGTHFAVVGNAEDDFVGRLVVGLEAGEVVGFQLSRNPAARRQAVLPPRFADIYFGIEVQPAEQQVGGIFGEAPIRVVGQVSYVF